MPERPPPRRSILQTLGVAGVGALGLGSLSTRTSATHQPETDDTDAVPGGWSSRHFDSGNTRYNPAGAGLDDAMFRWRTRFTQSIASPVVGGDYVYTVEAGNAGTAAVAVDRHSGAVQWRQSLDSDLTPFRNTASLALVDGLLIATLEAYVFAFDAGDGTITWSRRGCGSEFSAPTVSDGAVFVANSRGRVLALDAATGEELWRVEDIDDPDSPAVSPDGTTVHFTDGTTLYALATGDGTERWRSDVDYDGTVAVADSVYVASSGAVSALALDDGSVEWHREFDRDARSGPIVGDGRVFVHHDPRGVRALDATTGETLWTADFRWSGTSVADGEHLYVSAQETVEHDADIRDEIVALDSADGSEQWRFSRRYFDSIGSDAPTVIASNEALYAVIRDGVLYRIDERPAGIRWRNEIGQEPDRVAAASDGVVYAASTSDEAGAIAAFEPAAGELRWEVESDIVGRPVANDDYCFYAETYYVNALDAADGSVAWRERIDGKPRTSVHLHDGTLYLASVDDGGKLYAIDASDGRREWAVGDGQCERAIDVGSTTPAVVDDTVFAEVDDGLQGYATTDGSETCRNDQRVHALTGGPDVAVASWRGTVRAVATDGTVRWTRDLASDVTGLQTVGSAADGDGSADYVVARRVGSPGARYEALSLADGSTAWEFTAEEGPISMPATANGVAYVATGSGHLHAFDPSTGDVRETYDAYHGLHDRPAVVDGTVAVPSDEGFVYGFEEL